MFRYSLYIGVTVVLLVEIVIYGLLSLELGKQVTIIDKLQQIDVLKREAQLLTEKPKELGDRRISTPSDTPKLPDAKTLALASQALRSRQDIQTNSPEAIRAASCKDSLDLLVYYGPLLTRLKLRADDSAKFLRLVADIKQLPSDIAAGLPSNLTGSERYTTERTAIEAGKSALDEQILVLLGAANYAEYKNYIQNTENYLLPIQIQQIAVASGDALTQSQLDMLTAILKDDKNRSSANMLVPLEPGATGGTFKNQFEERFDIMS